MLRWAGPIAAAICFGAPATGADRRAVEAEHQAANPAPAPQEKSAQRDIAAALRAVQATRQPLDTAADEQFRGTFREWQRLEKSSNGILDATAKVPTVGASVSDDFDARWNRDKAVLEPAGITRGLFKLLGSWAELQYQLGGCTKHLRPSDVAFWRTWWDDTGLKSNPMFFRIWSMGDRLYNDGLRAADAEPISMAACRRIVWDMMAEIRAADAELAAEARSRGLGERTLNAAVPPEGLAP